MGRVRLALGVAYILKAVLGPPPALAACDRAREEGREAGLCWSLPPLRCCGDWQQCCWK